MRSRWLLVLVFACILQIGEHTGHSQEPQPQGQAAVHPLAQDERVMIYNKSRRLPVTVVAIRNLQSEYWLRDLEIEVRNNSGRPVYFVSIGLTFPDIDKNTPGFRPIIPLWFGRINVGNPGLEVTDEDVPIKPGETYVFRLPELRTKGFQQDLADYNIPASMTKRVRLCVDEVIFADGSSYLGDTFIPRKQD